MSLRQIYQRAAAILMIITSLFFITIAHAELLIFTGEGVYFLESSSSETINSAKKKAELDAWRIIVEQVKVDISSNSCVHNSNLSKDEIITIAKNILRPIKTKHAIEADDDALIVKAFVTATIDTEELETLLDNAIKNR